MMMFSISDKLTVRKPLKNLHGNEKQNSERKQEKWQTERKALSKFIRTISIPV